MERYEKLKLSLRYFLIGKQYFRAADALEFAAAYHTGTRKDGVTPEFQHQIEIAHYLRTLIPSLMYPEEVIATSFLHDVTEDYDVPNLMIRERFGDRIADAVYRLDKTGKVAHLYFGGLAECPVSSIVKGGDRSHNLQTMVGVFNRDKQRHYCKEVTDHFLPMLKQARRTFISQEAAYENIKHVLESQCELIEAIHATGEQR